MMIKRVLQIMKSKIADLLHASSFTALLIHRLNSSAKDPSSKILATRLSIKKRCFGKAKNLPVCLLYKTRIFTGQITDNQPPNGPLERTLHTYMERERGMEEERVPSVEFLVQKMEAVICPLPSDVLSIRSPTPNLIQ